MKQYEVVVRLRINTGDKFTKQMVREITRNMLRLSPEIAALCTIGVEEIAGILDQGEDESSGVDPDLVQAFQATQLDSDHGLIGGSNSRDSSFLDGFNEEEHY